MWRLSSRLSACEAVASRDGMVLMPGSPVKLRIRELRDRAAEERWGTRRLVTELVRTCDLGPLAAHRLARGWTLVETVRRFEELRPAGGARRTELTVQMLCAWERGRV